MGTISDPSEVDRFPGFTIDFNTGSEKGDSPEKRLLLTQTLRYRQRVLMDLKALFVPETSIIAPDLLATDPLAP